MWTVRPSILLSYIQYYFIISRACIWIDFPPFLHCNVVECTSLLVILLSQFFFHRFPSSQFSRSRCVSIACRLFLTPTSICISPVKRRAHLKAQKPIPTNSTEKRHSATRKAPRSTSGTRPARAEGSSPWRSVVRPANSFPRGKAASCAVRPRQAGPPASPPYRSKSRPLGRFGPPAVSLTDR